MRLLPVLMRAFPSDFRREFGADMVETIRRDYERIRARSMMRSIVFLVSTSVDLLWSGLRERLNPTWTRAARESKTKWEVGMSIEIWIKDLAYAARSLGRARSFSLVTTVTLALAIGATTAIFSVVDAVLLDPLPFPDANQLVSISASAPGSDFPAEFGVSMEFYFQYAEQADLLSGVALYNSNGVTARTDDRAERLRVSFVTPSFFQTLGLDAHLGRVPTAEDLEDVVAISHAMWTNWYGQDPSVLGRSLEIAGQTRTIVGIMDPTLRFPQEATSAWLPMALEVADVTPGRFGWPLLARMKPSVSTAAVAAQLAPLARRLPERFGGSANYARFMEQHRPVVRTLTEQLVGGISGALWVLLGTMGIVLLIACANVANLFMVRSESRVRHVAIRQALGAQRARLVRSQMAESILVAALGGTAGVALAWAGVPLLIKAAPPGVVGLTEVAIDGTALMFTAGISLVAALVCGLGPAIRASAPAALDSLRLGTRSMGRARHWGRDALVVVQTSLALVLLVGSALLVRSFWELRSVDLGFDIEDIFTFQIAPEGGSLETGHDYARFHLDFMARLRAMPGVESVGVVRELPLDEGTPSGRFVPENIEGDEEVQPFMARTYTGGEYFETMGIGLVSGRLFTNADHETDFGNALVSRSAAELLWLGREAVGERMRYAIDEEEEEWYTVVGVVEDIHQDDYRNAAEPLVYFPLAGRHPNAWVVGSPGYVVKSSRADALAADVRGLVGEVAPESPMYAVHTLEDLADESMVRLSFTMMSLGIASTLALILGAVGLYGVLSYVVTERTREIGVRMALGARAAEVRRMVVLQGSRFAGIGVVVGILVAVVATRALESLLFGVTSIDLPTFAGMGLVMLFVGFLASYVPARRASSVDPIRSLRAE